jgi:hypothetical protein
VVSGGAKGSLTVTWSGPAKFPVTMVYQMYSCPAEANCTDPIKSFPSSANPLVFPEAVWCAGFTQTAVFGYRVILIDADNKTTNVFPAPFTCNP